MNYKIKHNPLLSTLFSQQNQNPEASSSVPKQNNNFFKNTSQENHAIETPKKNLNNTNFKFFIPQQPQTSYSKTFKSLLSNHYVPNSYRNSLHSQQILSKTQASLSKHQASFESKLSFMERKQKIDSQIESITNESKKKLYKDMKDEMKSTFFAGKNSIFSECYKEFELLNLHPQADSDDFRVPYVKEKENNTEDLYYFLYKIHHFTEEKTTELLDNKENVIKKEDLKEIFTYLSENLQ